MNAHGPRLAAQPRQESAAAAAAAAVSRRRILTARPPALTPWQQGRQITTGREGDRGGSHFRVPWLPSKSWSQPSTVACENACLAQRISGPFPPTVANRLLLSAPFLPACNRVSRGSPTTFKSGSWHRLWARRAAHTQPAVAMASGICAAWLCDYASPTAFVALARAHNAATGPTRAGLSSNTIHLAEVLAKAVSDVYRQCDQERHLQHTREPCEEARAGDRRVRTKAPRGTTRGVGGRV